MDLYIKKSALEPELSRLQGILAKKPVIPIVENVLLRSEGNGHRVQFAGTNLDTTMVCAGVADQIVEHGSICIPARQTYELVRLLPEGIIRIYKEEGKQVLISIGRTKYKIPDANPDDFPSLPDALNAPTLTFSAKMLRTMIKCVEYAISPEEHVRFLLRGVKFESDASGTRMVGADGHRLAVASAPAEGLQMDDINVLIPHKALEDFNKLTADYDGQVEITAGENIIHFKAGERLLSSRMQAGEFPEYDKIIENVQTGMSDIAFQSAELSSAVKRSALAADQQSYKVLFDFSATELNLTAATSKAGESQEGILINYAGHPFKMGLNARYLLDFLSTVDSGQILMGVKDARSAVRLRMNKEGVAVVCVIMPMATNTDAAATAE